jgi:hypothetical protein
VILAHEKHSRFRITSMEDFVVKDSIEDSFTVMLIQLEEDTVEQGILVLDTPKATGWDGISPLILKKIVLVVKKPLAVLFNLSLLSGVCPCIWKESYIVPLFQSFEISWNNYSISEKLVWDSMVLLVDVLR